MASNKSEINELPYAVNITLYKHNYFDRLIVSHIKREYKWISVPNTPDSFIIEIDDLFEMIYSKFKKELIALESISDLEIVKNATSIYFINKILKNFVNLKYVKVNYSDQADFTRIVETAEKKFVINFEYKIITCIIDFGDYLINKEEFQAVNKILKASGLIKDDAFSPGKSYINTNTQDLLSSLNLYEQINFNEDGTPKTEVNDSENTIMVLDIIYELLDKKIQSDNSRLILITDYLN